MIHKRASIQDASIGEGSAVWQYASVIRGAVLGRDCVIGSCAIIDGALLGDDVHVGHGASVHPGTLIGNRVFIGPGAVLCNDSWPRAHKRGFAPRGAVIYADASIGANVTVLAGVSIGAGAMIAAGVTVARDVPARHLYGPNGAMTPIQDEEERCAARGARKSLKVA